jgi:hypothetical protein
MTSTLNLVAGVMAYNKEWSAVTNTIKLTSLVLGDTNKAVKKWCDACKTDDNPALWEGQQIFNEQAADAQTYNAVTVMLEDILQMINLLMVAVEEVFNGQQMAIVANAGKLAGAMEIVVACPESSSAMMAAVASVKQAQLWRALHFLMPLRYAVYIERDMGVSGSTPPCYNTWAEPVPEYGSIVFSNNLDGSDTQSVTSAVPWHFFQNDYGQDVYVRGRHDRTREFTDKLRPEYSSTAQCTSSRRIWLAVLGSPSQLAPDTFWQVLGSPTGLIPGYVSTLYNFSIEPGPEPTWRTMLGMCENVTRTYQPNQALVGESPWASDLRGVDQDSEKPRSETTVGWNVVGTGITYPNSYTQGGTKIDSSYDEMATQSVLSSVCSMFGIPVKVIAFPDCQVTQVMYSNEFTPYSFYPSHPALYIAPPTPTCINGFSVSSLAPAVVQLTSLNQYGLVPGECPYAVDVTGTAYFDLDAMGGYEKLPGLKISDRSVYQKVSSTPSRFIFFSGSQKKWIVGADVIGGPGLSISPGVPAGEDAGFYPSDTPCPLLGWVVADASKPDWVNASEPFWAGASNASLGNLSNASLYLADLANAWPAQNRTCCVPWAQSVPSDCQQAVCDCNSLYGLVSTRMISVEQYNLWEGRCSYCTFYGQNLEGYGLDNWAGGVGTSTLPNGSTLYTGGCGTMTSAGALAYVLKGNINSPVPTKTVPYSTPACTGGNNADCVGPYNGMVCGRYYNGNDEYPYQCCSQHQESGGVAWCANSEGGPCSDGENNFCLNQMVCGIWEPSTTGYACCTPADSTTSNGVATCSSV